MRLGDNAVLTRQWNLGHLLLGAMLLASLALGWRAVQVAREPLPVPPPFSAPPMAAPSNRSAKSPAPSSNPSPRSGMVIRSGSQ